MTTFHERIKLQSDPAHRAAEQAPFIDQLMGGVLTTSAYLDYLKTFLPIYQRMEELFREREKEGVLAYFDHRALDRANYIASDIKVLEDSQDVKPSHSTFSSISRYLESLTMDLTDVQLLAHHYIRYLGDLSGGQAISRLVARHYQVPKSALNFYNFDTLGDIVFYKNRYRDLLNLISLTNEKENEFIKEVLKLYELNRDLFLELGELHKPKIAVNK